jgi:putative transposase
MSRTARVVAPGMPHHVTQRGNRGLDVFFAADDYQQYLIWLAEYASRHDLKVWTYCLMTNHVHLVVVPGSAESLARTLRPLQMRHTKRINDERGWRGHLWRSRYYSCPLDGPHLWAAVRYVERNPVRSGLVTEAEAYPWSSAAPHCGLRGDPVLSHDLPLTADVDDWASWLRAEEDGPATEQLRSRTRNGMPCGADDFVEGIGRMLGLPLHNRRPGRPRKNRKNRDRHHFSGTLGEAP